MSRKTLSEFIHVIHADISERRLFKVAVYTRKPEMSEAESWELFARHLVAGNPLPYTPFSEVLDVRAESELDEVEVVIAPDEPSTLVYSHDALLVWTTFLQMHYPV